MTKVTLLGTTVTILGTCGICEREIAVQLDGNSFSLVHHGYRRPGDGQIHGDCFGVGYEPYERSTKACEDYKAMIERQVPVLEKRYADLSEGRITYLRKPVIFRSYSQNPNQLVWWEYAVGVTELYRFAGRIEQEKLEAKYALAQAQAEVARMQRLIDNFEVRELGTETRAGQKERAEKEARAAERAAKRAVRDEKARKVAEKKAVKEEKAAALKAKYQCELEAVLEKYAARDSLKSPALKFEALDVIARMAKECKKTPKVSFYARELGWEELFIRLGLAERTANGWVQYDVYNIGD